MPKRNYSQNEVNSFIPPPSFHRNRSPEPHYQGRKQCLSPWRMGSQVQRDTWPPRAGVAGQEPILHGRKRRCDNEAAPSLTAPANGKALRWEARLCKLDRFLPNTKRQGESRGVQLPFRALTFYWPLFLRRQASTPGEPAGNGALPRRQKHSHQLLT